MGDFAGVVSTLGQYGPGYLILAGVLYWLLVKYIPSQDKLHKEQIEALHVHYKTQQEQTNTLFKNSIEMIVNNYTEVSNGLMDRLEKIEAHIKI